MLSRVEGGYLNYGGTDRSHLHFAFCLSRRHTYAWIQLKVKVDTSKA